MESRYRKHKASGSRILFLQHYNKKSNNIIDKNKNLCKLFAIGYIRVFCYIFINFMKTSNTKLKEPLTIIKEINNFEFYY